MDLTQKKWVKPTKELVELGVHIELLKEHGDGGVTTEMRLHRGVVTETDGWSHGYIDAECWNCYWDMGRPHKCTPERTYFHFKDSFIRVLDKGRQDKEDKKIMKFYRVVKDNFLWSAGAILKEEGDNRYRPMSDIWDTTEFNGNEYISGRIIENNPEWFERVYEVSLIGKIVYETREKARELISRGFKSE